MFLTIVIINIIFWLIVVLFIKFRLFSLKNELLDITQNKELIKQQKFFIIFAFCLLFI